MAVFSVSEGSHKAGSLLSVIAITCESDECTFKKRFLAHRYFPRPPVARWVLKKSLDPRGAAFSRVERIVLV